AAEDARVGGLDVGVGAPDGGDAPVEVVGHGGLFAGGLGVEIDGYHLGLGALEQGVGGEEGVIRVGVQGEAAEQVYEQQRPEGRAELGRAAAGALGRVVGRAQDAGALVEVGL